MSYKSGETPAVGDSVMGEINGALGRGSVVRVVGDKVMVRQRAPYQGPQKPLQLLHTEVDASELDLVYRKNDPARAGAAPMAPRPAKRPRKGANAG